ncbi:MAG TPA: hypothetical protein VGT08_03050 [Terracidiphilus sp.]|nr:hypothetical protein [Terracidiphilus sp.]
MNRSILAGALMVATAAALTATLGAQQASQSGTYQGTSSPPPDDTITTSAPPTPAEAPAPKPSPAHSDLNQPAPVQYHAQPVADLQLPQQQTPASSALSSPADGTDDGLVQIAPNQPDLQVPPPTTRRGGFLHKRNVIEDPDGDIVHPAPLGPGALGEGTTIRTRLLERLSTSDSQNGDSFRTRVASDVLQGGEVLIPAGAEIDGKITNVSTGSFGGHGSMQLAPNTVIMPGGTRYRLYAQVTGTPGSGTRVGSEGSINPGSHLKRNGIEYGGGVGAGVITGAALGGPAGALAGSLVGAGLVTAHLLISHPQANLEEGTTLLFSLTEPLYLVPAGNSGN